MKRLTINLSDSHPIFIENNLFTTNFFIEYCKKLQRKLVIITDDQLISQASILQSWLSQHELSAEIISFPAGETNKTRETKQKLEDELFSRQYGRDTCLIGLGGGVVLDMAGFIAATYCRGIPVIYLPTTLLAMVDACIGGKTAVNTPFGKNLIGTFSQPHAIFINTSYLKTLPKKEFSNGMAEIIKHSIIFDENLFELLENQSEIIKQCNIEFLTTLIEKNCLIKKNVVEQDETDQGIRHSLNFGHTIGHAIEKLTHFTIPHGEAVAIGILIESYLSVLTGHLPNEDFNRIEQLLIRYQLINPINLFSNKEKFKQALILDKKSVDNIPHFVLPTKIGALLVKNNTYIHKIAFHLIDQALDWATEYWHQNKYCVLSN